MTSYFRYPATGGVTTPVSIANGGTGQTTANTALNALLPDQTGANGEVLTSDGTNASWTAVAGTGTVTSVDMTVPAFLAVAGNPIVAAGTLAVTLSGTALPVVNGGTGVTTSTGTGATVRSTSPTLVTPILGTPTSGTLTNATGLPLTTGVTGVLPIANGGTNAATTSANLVFAGPTSGGSAAPSFRAAVTADVPANLIISSAGIVIDGGGSAITTGSKGFIQIPYGATVSSWTVLADQSGSIVVDVKRSTYAGFPSTTSIVGGGGNKPTLSSVQNNTAAPSSWTSTAITAGDVLEFNVDSASTVTRVTVQLKLTRT